MYTWALINLHKRLAAEGEELVAHRFASGCIGMVSRSDFESWRRSTIDASKFSGTPSRSSVLQSIKNTFSDFLAYYGFRDPIVQSSDGEPGPVVGIPTEALVRIFDISEDWQAQYQLGESDDALCAEVPSVHECLRTVLCFGNGVTIPFQFLNEGQRVRVLRRSWPDALEYCVGAMHRSH